MEVKEGKLTEADQCRLAGEWEGNRKRGEERKPEMTREACLVQTNFFKSP